MEQLTDEQLVKAYLRGDEKSLELLIQRYLSPLYNFAFKYVHTQSAAEDVVQDAMIKIWKNIKKFNSEYKFKTWAFTITKNTALDHLKKKGLVVLPENLDIDQMPLLEALSSELPLPEQALEKIDDVELIKTAVSSLPSKYQQILSLYYDHELNFREIAELLKQSINTVKTRHRRAVLFLKKQLIDK